MRKPTVYLDTSIISAYWYEGADVALLARRLRTREWWVLERRHFQTIASRFVESELVAGAFPRQGDCVRMIRRIGYLRATAAMRSFVHELTESKIVPANKAIDVAHLAVATVAGLDYLLTWNYSHLANPIVQRRLDEICLLNRLRGPLLVTPETIPQVRFGQNIRRPS